ncbi:sterol desaturase family protein [Pelomonas sp. KK5]|uniref:sterol desaturase family protein n=1 Tax=Pelomonas sp. KK5 TaxID=1855730 RepID=UPI00097C6AD7|nr:sterol desaturase family protein [Pelomonas sp. KK5]
METIDLVGLAVPGLYFTMLAVEARWPARRFPPRRGWRWLGIGCLLLIAAVGAVTPLLLPLDWLAAHRWLDGSALGVAGGTLLGWVVLSALSYAYHRACHRSPLLWRLLHQMHHSPQRVDLSGAALFHPLEMLAQTLIQLFVTVIVLGLDPLAAALVGVVAAFYGMFQHWNVRTPRWLGYLIQRPEAHCEHHRMGVHALNYADLPWWDLIAGSFANPERFEGECGFEPPADRRLGAMLAWQDVNDPLYGRASRGAAMTASVIPPRSAPRSLRR